MGVWACARATIERLYWLRSKGALLVKLFANQPIQGVAGGVKVKKPTCCLTNRADFRPNLLILLEIIMAVTMREMLDAVVHL